MLYGSRWTIKRLVKSLRRRWKRTEENGQMKKRRMAWMGRAVVDGVKSLKRRWKGTGGKEG